jgi:hypothetical protein
MTQTTRQTAVPPAILPVKYPDQRFANATKPCFVVSGSRCLDEYRGANILAIDGAVQTYICAHAYRAGDVWFDYSSGCLPVMQGPLWYLDYDPSFDGGDLTGNVAVIETQLSFGAYRFAFDGQSSPALTGDSHAQASTDGFLLVMIVAQNGERGVASCNIDGVPMAATSVHNYPNSNNWIWKSGFCLPVAKSAEYAVYLQPSNGSPVVSAWWLPSTSQDWRFLPPVLRDINQNQVANTDGFLTATADAWGIDGGRGFLKLFAGDDVKTRPQNPLACASVHVYGHSDRWISAGSAMLPVQIGSPYFVEFDATAGKPKAQAYWTAIVPV